MMWIYKAVVLPKISYGCVVWGFNLTKSQEAKLATIQTLAQRLVTRCKDSTPKVLLDILLNNTHLPLKIKEMALKRSITLKEEGHWNDNKTRNPAYSTNQDKIDDALKEIIGHKIKKGSTDKIPPTTALDKNYCIKISDKKDIHIKDETLHFLIFTDGSRDDQGCTGYGVTFSEETLEEISEPLRSFNDIFQAEAMAVLKGAETIENLNLSNLKIEFYTDNQGVLKALNKRIIKNGIILSCHDTLNKLAINNTVTLNWIPGHMGYEGNERADTLAKEGRLKPINDSTYNKIPFSNIIYRIGKHYSDTLKPRYQNAGLSSEARIITDEVLSAFKFKLDKLSKTLLKLSLKDIQTAFKLLSGHNCLNYHLQKCNMTPDDKCDYCTEVIKHTDYNWDINCMETAFHILCKCQFFSILRGDIFHKHILESSDLFAGKDTIYNLLKIIHFFNKSKVLNRKPKYTKQELSPYRPTPKRKREVEQPPEDIPKPKRRTLVLRPHNTGTLMD
jgi:ribonuclease HI